MYSVKKGAYLLLFQFLVIIILATLRPLKPIPTIPDYDQQRPQTIDIDLTMLSTVQVKASMIILNLIERYESCAAESIAKIIGRDGDKRKVLIGAEGFTCDAGDLSFEPIINTTNSYIEFTFESQNFRHNLSCELKLDGPMTSTEKICTSRYLYGEYTTETNEKKVLKIRKEEFENYSISREQFTILQDVSITFHLVSLSKCPANVCLFSSLFISLFHSLLTIVNCC